MAKAGSRSRRNGPEAMSCHFNDRGFDSMINENDFDRVSNISRIELEFDFWNLGGACKTDSASSRVK